MGKISLNNNTKIRVSKSKKLIALMVGAGMLISSIIPSTKVFATGGIQGSEIKNLGNYKTYNAVVFGDHVASGADIEGRLAVKGDITAPTKTGNYGIGGAFNGNTVAMGEWITDTSTPTFLLGGAVKKTHGNITLETGTGVVGSKANKDYIFAGSGGYKGVIKVADEEITKTFDGINSSINSVINTAKKYTPSSNKIDNAEYGVVESNEDSKVLVNTVGRNEKSIVINGTGYSTNLPNLEGRDFYIFYSDAEEVMFEKDFYYNGGIAYSHNMKELGIAEKIMWVFPNAKKVTTFTTDVPGTIICPNAELNLHGASINGQVFTKDLNQVPRTIGQQTGENGEVHNFKFNWDKWNGGEEEQPGTSTPGEDTNKPEETPGEDTNKPEETPGEDVETPGEDVENPEEEVPGEQPEENKPEQDVENPTEDEVKEEEKNEGDLPKTGGIPAVAMLAVGAAMVAGGVSLSKKRK